MNRNYGFGAGILLLIGGVIGAFLALMFGTDEDGETKDRVRENVKLTKDAMREVKTRHIDPAIEVMGEKSREAMQKFDDALQELNDELVALKGGLSKVDRSKYDEVVGEVITDLRKSGDYTSGQLRRLSTYFKEDYDQVMTEARAQREDK